MLETSYEILISDVLNVNSLIADNFVFFPINTKQIT